MRGDRCKFKFLKFFGTATRPRLQFAGERQQTYGEGGWSGVGYDARIRRSLFELSNLSLDLESMCPERAMV